MCTFPRFRASGNPAQPFHISHQGEKTNASFFCKDEVSSDSNLAVVNNENFLGSRSLSNNGFWRPLLELKSLPERQKQISGSSTGNRHVVAQDELSPRCFFQIISGFKINDIWASCNLASHYNESAGNMMIVRSDARRVINALAAPRSITKQQLSGGSETCMHVFFAKDLCGVS